MKFVKGISLFFVYPFFVFSVGFGFGMWAEEYFYPGSDQDELVQEVPQLIKDENILLLEQESLQQVAQMEDTLNADTDYVLEERDLLRETVVETVWNIPAKYIGMNREQFLEAMEEYKESPPLSEKERGFVGLEVKHFSTEKVVVQMNYQYVQPSDSFYLAVMDNEVVVLLEDKETVYINTGILLKQLPEAVQMSIIQMQYMENEEELFDFLESYSS